MNGTEMHWLDVTILGVLGTGVLVGAATGFVKQLVGAATFVLSLYTAIYLHEPMGQFVGEQFTGVSLPRLVSGASSFVITYLVVFVGSLLARRVIVSLRRNQVDCPTGLKVMNRLLGASVGLIFASLVLGTVFVGLAFLPSAELEGKMHGSTMRPTFIKTTQAIVTAIPQRQKDELSAALDHLEKTGIESAAEVGGQGVHHAAGMLDNAASEMEKARKERGEGQDAGIGQALSGLQAQFQLPATGSTDNHEASNRQGEKDLLRPASTGAASDPVTSQTR